MWFITFLLMLLALLIAVAIGARYHAQVNARMAKILRKDEGLPADFELWLSNHKGEYDTLGKAMGAWADAKYGDKYKNLL